MMTGGKTTLVAENILMTKTDLIKKLETHDVVKIIDGTKVSAVYWSEKLPSLLLPPPVKRRKRRVTKTKR